MKIYTLALSKNCPKCGRDEELDLVPDNYTKCNSCGHRFKSTPEKEKPTTPKSPIRYDSDIPRGPNNPTPKSSTIAGNGNAGGSSDSTNNDFGRTDRSPERSDSCPECGGMKNLENHRGEVRCNNCRHHWTPSINASTYKIIKISGTLDLSDMSDDWQDVVDYVDDYGITLDQLMQMKNIAFERMEINGEKLFVVYDGDKTYVADSPDNFPDFKEAHDWIDSMWDGELDTYIPDVEHDFWEYPVTLYHATVPENVPSIKQYGLRMEDQSRGISNRNMGSAIFTSYSDEDISSYGDVIIAINTVQMKQDEVTPTVSGESPLENSAKKSQLANLIGLQNYQPDEYNGEGYSDNTLAIYGGIHPKYLTFYENN